MLSIILCNVLKKETSVIFRSNERYSSYQDKEREMVNSYIKSYPKLFYDKLSAKEGYILGKKELGFECIKNKDELKKILGFDSIIKKIITILFSLLYDLRYDHN